MSDENTVPEVPALPAPPEAPQDSSAQTVTLKTPASLLETPDTSSESSSSSSPDVEDTGEGSDTEPAPEDLAEPTEGQEEAAPADPVVTTTPTGQSVTMPDGRVVYTRSSDAPASNSEWQAYEQTHQGDQLRYAFVPGDKEYTPYSDPSVPDSRAANQIEREIGSFAERVLIDPNAEVSYMWNALQGNHQGELDRAIATGGGEGKVMA